MVLTLTQEDYMRMKRVVLDHDETEAFLMIRELCKRIEQQKQHGLKSHLDAC